MSMLALLFEHLFTWQHLWQPKFYKENEGLTQKSKQWREKVKT